MPPPASAAATASCRGSGPRATSRYPLSPGHEWSGTVEAVGAGVDRVLVGRRSSARASATARSATAAAPGDDAVHRRLRGDRLHPARRVGRHPDPARPAAARPARGADLRPPPCWSRRRVVAAAALKALALPGERVAVVGRARSACCRPVARASRPSCGRGHRPDREPAARAVRRDRLPRPRRDSRAGFDVVVETAGSPPPPPPPQAAARRTAGADRDPRPRPADGLDPTDLVVRQLTVPTVFGAPPGPGRTPCGCSAPGC